MSQSTHTDARPAAGWGKTFDGRPTFTKHDASFLDDAPAKDGFKPAFVGRHGVGPGSWTTWTFKPAKEA